MNDQFAVFIVLMGMLLFADALAQQDADLPQSVVEVILFDFEGDENAEVLARESMVWAGLKGGVAAEADPLPISVWEETCLWRKAAIAGLEAIGRPFRIAFQSSRRAVSHPYEFAFRFPDRFLERR